MKYFLTVDWCGKGQRGVFCAANGGSFIKDGEPHTEDEMWAILGAFDMILHPQSLPISEAELKEYHLFYPLAEYSNMFGIACKE
jgi:hypothetical protein